MAIPIPKKSFAFGWNDPKPLFNEEAYEDNQPFMQDMQRISQRKWSELVQRASIVDPQNGKESVIAAWKKHVLEGGREPEEVADYLQKQIEKLETDYQTQQIKIRQLEMETRFKEAILKEEALSMAELEAIDCTPETTRDILLAAGYGSKWFDISKMEKVHEVMARRLRDLGMLEERKVYNQQAFSIGSVHRLKGT